MPSIVSPTSGYSSATGGGYLEGHLAVVGGPECQLFITRLLQWGMSTITWGSTDIQNGCQKRKWLAMWKMAAGGVELQAGCLRGPHCTFEAPHLHPSLRWHSQLRFPPGLPVKLCLLNGIEKACTQEYRAYWGRFVLHSLFLVPLYPLLQVGADPFLCPHHCFCPLLPFAFSFSSLPFNMPNQFWVECIKQKKNIIMKILKIFKKWKLVELQKKNKTIKKIWFLGTAGYCECFFMCEEQMV